MTSTADTLPGRPTPVDPQERIVAIDMVRGFALFGVLLVNMYNFGAYSPLFSGVADQSAFSFMRFFFETKSWRLFSFLFGLGFSLQLLRAQDRGDRFILKYIRRLAILFVIGLAHALLYRGDILRLYAELGLVLVLFWKAPPRFLLVTAVLLLSAFPIGRTLKSLPAGEGAVSSALTESAIDVAALQAERDEFLRTHPDAVGSLRDVLANNAERALRNPLADDPRGPESNLAVFAMFLLGLYAGRRGIFQNIETNLPLIRSVFRWGLGLGLTGMVVERVLAFGWNYQVFRDGLASPPVELIGGLAFGYGSTALSLGYASAIVLIGRKVRWQALVKPLGPVGRMALTVYLAQSVVFTTVFYGYGLGMTGRLGPAAVTVSAVLIFGLTILACSWWLRRFRFGPVEWVWRSLTYLRVPQLRPSRLNMEAPDEG